VSPPRDPAGGQRPAAFTPRTRRLALAVAAVALASAAVKLLLLAVLTAPAPASASPSTAPVVLRDDRGTEHRFAAPPRRIVSLLPSLTESVFALGGGARVVGVDRFANWPPEVARLPRLGGLDDAPIEAIVALRPDVVLASSSARATERLQALGVPVVMLRSDTHEDLRRSLVLLAALLGRPGEGDALWARLQARIDAAAARVPPALRGRSVYFELGGGPFAAGAGSFIGQTLARLGLAHVVPAELGPFPRLNPEFVLRARPEVVMAGARHLPAMAERPGWATLPAFARGQRCGFTPEGYELLIRPGPRLGEAAELIADCLQALGPPAAVAPRP
jgi:iron complex transport system substrate-binding protein